MLCVPPCPLWFILPRLPATFVQQPRFRRAESMVRGDRSPTRTGCSARMAVLRAQGRMQVGGRFRARSIIGSEFECGIDSLTSLGKKDAIVPTVSGRAWITGTHQLVLDPDDPWPEGYRIADTWPVM